MATHRKHEITWKISQSSLISTARSGGSVLSTMKAQLFQKKIQQVYFTFDMSCSVMINQIIDRRETDGGYHEIFF
jgi:uncharacterized membrane protein YsdA (DUF1294 family)